MNKLLEAFFDYYSGYLSVMETDIQGLQIYKNPGMSEIKKYAPYGARGYVDPKGNLYLECYEGAGEWRSQEKSRIVHADFLEILEMSAKSKGLSSLRKTLSTLLSDDWSDYNALDDVEELGVCVVLEDKDKFVIQLAESYDRAYVMEESPDTRDAIERLFSKAKEMNRSLIFRY